MRPILVPLVAAGLVAAGVFVLSFKLLPPAKAERTWSAVDGTPVPSDFIFLMFPVDDKVPVFDSERGQRVGVLERALGNDVGELQGAQADGAKWLQVPWFLAGHKPGFVRASDLRYLAPAVAGTVSAGTHPPNYVGAFFTAYRERKPDAHREVWYQVHTGVPEEVAKEAAGKGEGRYVTLRLRDSGNLRWFHALVTPEKGVPLAIDQLYTGAKSSAVLTRWIVGGGAALVAGGLAWVATSAVARRRDPLPSSVV